MIESKFDYIESNLQSMDSTLESIVPIGTVYCLQYCYLFSRWLRYKTQQIAATMGKKKWSLWVEETVNNFLVLFD